MILLALLFMYQVTEAQLGNINGRRIVDFNENMRCKREDASTAFGYTNFNIKLKKDMGLKKKPRKETTSLDTSFSGGPYRVVPWRNVNIPLPLLLNERIRNPKFISRHPKRNNIDKKNPSPNLNPKEVSDISKKKALPQAAHANILNTNYRFAYLARKNKAKAVIKRKHQQDKSGAIDGTLGLKKRRRKRIFRRKKIKKIQSH